jgi:membrane glycosyltransferase
MSYVSSPLWLLLLVVSINDMMSEKLPVGLEPLPPLFVSHASELLILVVATVVALYGPKLLAVLAILESPEATRAHGGAGAVLWSALLESIFATLMAPIVMLQHSWFVFSILMGMATGWNAQTRADRALPLGLVARKFAPHTIIGLAAAFLLQRYAADGFDWFLPLLAGLWIAIPLVAVSSSPMLGKLARQEGVFLVPSETWGSKVLARAHVLASCHEAGVDAAPELVLDDPRVRDLHLSLLEGAPAPTADPLRLWSLWEHARRRDTADFSREDWALLLSDFDGLKSLGVSS